MNKTILNRKKPLIHEKNKNLLTNKYLMKPQIIYRKKQESMKTKTIIQWKTTNP